MRRELPSISPMERALYLRSLPFFGDLRSSDLAACAQLLEEVRLRRHEILYSSADGVSGVYLLVEGRVRSWRGDRLVQLAAAPAVAGFVELLASQPAIPRAQAETSVLALRLDAGALLDLMEDHFTIFVEARRTLGAELRELQLRTKDFRRVQPPRGLEIPDRALDPAEHLLMLQRYPLFQCVGLGVLAALLRDQEETQLKAEEVLWQAGDEPHSLFVVIHGTISCRPEDAQPFEVRSGDAVGAEAVFGGTPYAYAAVAATDVRALRIDGALLIDLAEDNFDLAQCTLGHVAREVLRLRELVASVAGSGGRS